MKNFFILLTLITLSCSQVKKSDKIFVKWLKNVNGDFSFKKKWNYPEGVYLNQFGQLSCDGFCPMEIEKMKDTNGKIFEDSIDSFYELIDTSHLYYSIKSYTNAYEFGEANYIHFEKMENDTIYGYTHVNAGTHSSLHLKLTSDYCTAWVEYNSVKPVPIKNFLINDGLIKLDNNLFNQGIIKAEFDFVFENTLNIEKDIYWKGKIFSQYM